MIRRALLRALPGRWRDGIEGDLNEAAAGVRSPWRQAWIVGMLLVLIVRFALAALLDRLPRTSRFSLHRLLTDVRLDTRYGIRRWRGRPGFTVAAVLTIALGVGTTAALFSIVDGVLLKPLPYPSPDRLVSINRTYPDWRNTPVLAGGWDRISLSWPEYFQVRDRTRTLEDLAVITTRVAVVQGATAQELRVGVVSSSFFPLLGVTPVRGRAFATEDDVRDPGTVVITHDLWTSRYGSDPAIVGKVLKIRGGDRVIAGVLPRDFTWGTRQLPYPLFYPLAAIPENERADNNRNLDAVGRLRPGVPLAAATDEMTVILKDVFRFKGVTGGVVTPFMERALRRVRQPLLVLLAGAILLLLISCSNVAGLLTADAASREGEIALRASLGATRLRVLRQLAVEGLLLSGVGAVLGLLVATWAMRGLVALAPADLPRVSEIGLDHRVLAVVAVAACTTALLFALLPAVGLHRRGVTVSATRVTTTRRRVATALATLQVAVGIALLSGAGLLVRSLKALEAQDVGFSRERVLSMRAGLPFGLDMDEARSTRYFAEARERLAALPGVASAAISASVPLGSGASTTTLTFPQQGGPPVPFEAQRRFVSPEFFETLRIRTVSGRVFQPSDTVASPAVAVVSRAMERRLWPDGAVGKTLPYAGRDHLVVGVVEDVRDVLIDRAAHATFYLSTTQRSAWPRMYLLMRTEGDPVALADTARRALLEIDPSIPVEEVLTLNDVVFRATDDERYRAVLMGIFALAATLLAAVGLYNMLARRVVDRRREIGVRLALGAKPSQVRRLFMREGVRVAVMGTALGVPLAIIVGRSVESILFGVRASDVPTVATVVAIASALALIATYIPSIRASRVDPIEVLRQ